MKTLSSGRFRLLNADLPLSDARSAINLAQFFLLISTHNPDPMPTIHLTTFIAAPIERVFDLSRSIDLHKRSMHKRKEQAVNGVTYGLINEGETVTWKAKHFYGTRFLKVKVSSMNRPVSFTDESVSGDLKNMKHEHHFKTIDNGTLMIDIFSYDITYGPFGKLINKMFLVKYLEQLLEERNAMIKEYAEGDKWKFLLEK